MIADNDLAQYREFPAAALAWREEQETAHAAGRMESLRQAVIAAAKHGHEVGRVFVMETCYWQNILEAAALLPPEGGEGE